MSIIIPAHRLDAWLDEAVGSVLGSVDVAPEVIVVLNGMTEMEQRPWMDSAQVRVIHVAEPLGPTSAMIRGVDASHGEFIGRLDADDRMMPTRLAAQLGYLERNVDTPLVGTAVIRITERGDPAGRISSPSGDDVRPHLVLANVVTHSSVMMRRSALDAVGGYDARLDQMEDYDVILRLAQRGPIAVLPQELTEYRLHPGQISRGAKPTGAHIDRVIDGRRSLGKLVGMSVFSVWARNSVWRAVQFTRYWRITKPGHEY